MWSKLKTVGFTLNVVNKHDFARYIIYVNKPANTQNRTNYVTS